MEPWFDEEMAGVIGAILGGGFGGLWCGGVLGGMSSFYINKGLKKLAYGLYGFSFAVGIVLMGTGLFALLTEQPRYVWWLFSLCGMITAVVTGAVFPVIRKRFADREKQIMAIEDL